MSEAGLSKVKLSDVGLSRPLLNAQYYRKTTKGKVPAKWMAIESLFEERYTHASDVWSFGVLAWEVFAFGEEPYAGLSPEDAVRSLIRGNRLSRPDACPVPVFDHHEVSNFDLTYLFMIWGRYDLLLRMWQKEEFVRPEFHTIVVTLQLYIDNSEETAL